MEQNKIDTVNKRFALFMGATVISAYSPNTISTGEIFLFTKENAPNYCLTHGSGTLRYHLSWDWLMPVWFKFRETRHGDMQHLHNNYCARLAQDLAYGTLEEFYHNLGIAVEWLDSLHTN